MTSTGQIDSKVADVPAEVTSPAASSRPSRTVRALLPWLVVAAAAALVLHHYGTPAADLAVYAAYLVVAVLLPGTLVFRALWGSRGNWPEDLGLGAATGMFMQLIGWAIGAATGQHLILTIWPIAILVVFAAVPGLRRHWRPAEVSPLPIAWSWGMALVLLALIGWAATQFRALPLPPVTAQYYPDVYYHLSLIHEMTRSMPFQVPQLAGDWLRYHYLSDADMATAGLVTHIEPTTVFLRLWILPVVSAAAIAAAALARTVVTRWWAGPVAAAVAFVGEPLYANSPMATTGTQPISLLSPSQAYSVPLLAVFVLVAVEKLRGDQGRVARGWAGWAALPLLAVACAGAKSSALPPLLAGLLLTAVYLWWRRRTIPWVAVGLLASVAFGMGVGFRIFAGGGAGTLGLQPLSLLRWIQPYTQTLGKQDGVAPNGLLPPGIQHAGAGGLVFVAIVVVWFLLMQSPRLIGLVVPDRERTGDPAPFLLGGMILAGIGAALLLWHPSASQVYFFNGAVPFGVVLTVRAMVLRTRGWRVPSAGAAAGALWTWFGLKYRAPADPTIHRWALALVVPMLVAAGIAVVLAAIGIAVRRRRALRALPVALLAAVLAGSVAGGVEETGKGLHAHRGPSPLRVEVTAPEMRAALWLDQNAGADDVVATNVHCMPMNAPRCDARAFWVAGLGGRRGYVESWGYSDQTVGANGVNGLKYMYQPAPYPDRFALNQRVFTTGDAGAVAELRAQGVKWLFADTRAGQVAPALARAAHVSYTAGPVTVYQLNPVS